MSKSAEKTNVARPAVVRTAVRLVRSTTVARLVIYTTTASRRAPDRDRSSSTTREFQVVLPVSVITTAARHSVLLLDVQPVVKIVGHIL